MKPDRHEEGRALAHHDIALAFRRGVGRLRAEYRTARITRARSKIKKVQDIAANLEKAYYFTSEKGVFRLDRTGVHQVLDLAAYGIAIHGEWIFLAVYSYDYSIVVRGDRRALSESGRSFDFREIYRLQTLSTNERIHGMFCGSDALWVANTGRNTLLKVDPRKAEVVAEIPVIVDRFGRSVLFDNNHINSVSEYDGVVLFAAYRAGHRSMIGVYDGTSVTGFGYPRAGVHDIFLWNGGFLLCDTFGENTEVAGGALITQDGVFDSEFFSKPPGCIVRGLAGTVDELLIGHSHKGVRSKRFNGHGAILVARNGRVEERLGIHPAQVYQIITEDGAFAMPSPRNVDASSVKRMLMKALGEPIYCAEVSPFSRVGTAARHGAQSSPTSPRV